MSIKDYHTNMSDCLLRTKGNVEKSGFMLAPDVIWLISTLVYTLEENKKMAFQLQHAWQNNGEYIEYKKEILH